jgi:hypothetical protein
MESAKPAFAYPQHFDDGDHHQSSADDEIETHGPVEEPPVPLRNDEAVVSDRSRLKLLSAQCCGC